MGAFLESPITDKKIEVYQHKKLRACTCEMQGKIYFDYRLEEAHGRRHSL